MTTPSANLGDMARGVADGRRTVDLGEPAGWAHVRLCGYCREVPIVDPDLCSCRYSCTSSRCPREGSRPCGATYSEGFTPPPIPLFRKGNE